MSYDQAVLRSQQAGGAYTFATLPTPLQMQSEPLGILAYTTDQGMVYWNGTVWGMVVGATFLPVSNDTLGITAAALAASVNGGGTVKIPPISISLTAPLPLLSGVTYEGTGFGIDFSTSPATFSGTQLVGNGTFDCFTYNAVDRHTGGANSALVLTQQQWLSSQLHGGGVRGLSMKNFAIGVHIGDYYSTGGDGFVLDEVAAVSCTGFGFWLENCNNFKTGRIFVEGCAGYGWIGSSPNGLWNHGNAYMQQVFGETQAASDQLKRGWILNARGATGGILNAITIGALQSNRTGTTVTQQSASTNGTTSITVSDGTKFAVNMPVFFDSFGAGPTNGKIYFINSVSGNTVTVGNVQIDVNQSFTALTLASSSGHINTYGFPHLEVSGYNGNQIQPCSFQGMDMENSCTTGIHLQNTFGHTFTGQYIGFGVQNTNFQRTVTCRNASNNTFFGFGVGGTPVDMESDNSSNGNQAFTPRPSNYSGPVTGTSFNQMGMGIISSDPSGRLLINNSMGLFLSGYTPELAINQAGFMEMPNFPLGIAATAVGDGTGLFFFGPTHTQHLVYIGNGGAGITLPTIPANGEGVEYLLINATANNFVVTTDGTQLIYNSDLAGAHTLKTFTVAAFKAAAIRASYNFNGTGTTTNYFWMRTI